MSTPFRLESGTLTLDAQPLVRGVAETLSLTPDPTGAGTFLTARAHETSSRQRFDLGELVGLKRFTACHRYEPFWMKPRAGTRLSEVPPETQSFIGRLADGRWLLLVPLVGELFRFSLRGKPDHTVELLAESGDPFAPGLGGLAAFLSVGDDPFALAQRGAEAVAARLGAGRLRREKALPDFTDLFGWCTWDAFYQEVSHEKVREGLASFAAGGVEPRFLILDDGWQSTARLPTGEKRLTAFAANDKFPAGLSATVAAAKQDFSVRVFLVWHAVIGYWGGIDGASLPGYDVVDQPRQFGEGVLFHAPLFNQDWWGNLVGFVPPKTVARFYDDYHRELRAAGVDGVKVDNQAVLESVGQRHGGRVPVAAAYRAGLEASVRRHFDGRLINCMSNAQETFYFSPDSTLIRTSIDFFPRMPETHCAHLYANSQVGVWFGEFMHPDWDMFQSGHEWGAFHASGRAVSGGPIYVSDGPECHDFALLSSLVCSDGSVLRAELPGRPTLDTLLCDPTTEDVPLKIWNRSGAAGLVGVFNCRYAPEGGTPTLSGTVSPSDVPGLAGAEFAALRYGEGGIRRIAHDERLEVTLGPAGHAIYTFAPIDAGFAALGLAGKLIGVAAVSEQAREASAVELGLRDGGELLAYCAEAPRRCRVAGADVEFAHEPATGTLRVKLAPGAQRLRIEW